MVLSLYLIFVIPLLFLCNIYSDKYQDNSFPKQIVNSHIPKKLFLNTPVYYYSDNVYGVVDDVLCLHHCISYHSQYE